MTIDPANLIATGDQSNARTDSLAPVPEKATRHVIVSQLGSGRVVYFTDDPEYQPASEGDWYCSVFAGALPEGLTLRNCWRWCFTGGAFVEPEKKPSVSASETLLEANRRALHQILQERMAVVRRPFLPSCVGGEWVRVAKLREARDCLSATPSQTTYPLLEAAAAARGLAQADAAKLIIANAHRMEETMMDSERFREQLAVMIDSARSEEALRVIRDWLLNLVHPELTKRAAQRISTIDNTQPIDLLAPLNAHTLLQETDRLRLQLRWAINRMRKPIQSHYIGHAEIRRQKLVLARHYLDQTASSAAGFDYSSLLAWADARKMGLSAAATLVIDDAGIRQDLLVETEAIKDRLLANIDAIKTMQDVLQISAEIEAMSTDVAR